MSKKQERIFNILKTLAISTEPVGNAQLASAIIWGNEIISFGTNSKKSNPFQKKFGKNPDCIYPHSEIAAIKNALKKISVDKLAKVCLYTVRVRKNNSIGCSRSCIGCQRAINTFGIKKVFYTEDDKDGFRRL